MKRPRTTARKKFSTKAHQKKLALRLRKVPVIGQELFALANILIYDKAARIAILLASSVGCAALAALPKIWRVTPENLPAVRISVLDFFQASTLAQSAARADSKRELAKARHAWHSAIANHPGHKGHLRSFLNSEIQRFDHHSIPIDGNALNYALYLLRLTHTNASDLNLTLDLADRLGAWNTTRLLVSDLDQQRVSPSSIKANLRATFWDVDGLGEFYRAWKEADPAIKESPDLTDYRLAFEALPFEETVRTNALKELRDRAQSSVANNGLVPRIRARVEAAMNHLEGYESAIEWIATHEGVAPLEYQSLHWIVLSRNGANAKAREMATRSVKSPESMHEITSVISAFRHIGLSDEIAPFLLSAKSTFGAHPDFALLLIGALTQNGHWETLDNYLRELSASPTATLPWMRAYLGYVEGVAYSQSGSKSRANAAFDQATRLEDPLPLSFNVQVARLMAKFQPDSVPLSALRKIADVPGIPAEYWKFRARVAENELDLAETKLATRRYWDLNPEDDQAALAYSGLCILSRDSPQELSETLQITESLRKRFPNDPWVALHHAYAQFLSGQVTSSEMSLRDISTAGFTNQQSLTRHLLLLELAVANNEPEDAQDLIARINEQDLTPWQRPWWDRAVRSAQTLRAEPNP